MHVGIFNKFDLHSSLKAVPVQCRYRLKANAMPMYKMSVYLNMRCCDLYTFRPHLYTMFETLFINEVKICRRSIHFIKMLRKAGSVSALDWAGQPLATLTFPGQQLRPSSVKIVTGKAATKTKDKVKQNTRQECDHNLYSPAQ